MAGNGEGAVAGNGRDPRPGGPGGSPAPGDVGLTPTPDTCERLSPETRWDEATRPTRPQPPADAVYTDRGRAIGAHLIEIHDHLRAELARIHDLIRQVREGAADAASARSAISEMTIRHNDWALGAYCASYCRFVTGHHMLEDEAVFPYLRERETGLGPVIDRLADEHKIIHQVLNDVDQALVDHLRNPADFAGLQQAVDILTDSLLSHLAYEEAQLVEPLARHGFYRGQI